MPFLTSGSYGCIYKPHIPCPSEKPIKFNGKKTIGKIFGETEDFTKENNINKLIQKLDPDNQFTLPILGHCKTKLTKRDASKCEHLDFDEYSQDKYQQLIQEYGGKDLLYILKHKKPYKDSINNFIKQFVPIVKGLALVNNSKFTHLDVKPDNILFDGKRMYLIDFGLMTKYNSVYNKDKTFILKHDYPFYPPEFKAYVTNSYEEFYTSFFSNFSYKFTISKKKIDLLEWLQEKINYTEEEQHKDLRELFKNRRKFNNKIDVYSFGIILLLIYVWAKRYIHNVDQYVSIIKDCILFDPNKRISLMKLKERLEKYTSDHDTSKHV
jgi:serine/threonine protein kinase